MKDIKQAQHMLSLSRRDHRTIQNMTDADKFDDAVFGFHAQQAVEKSLKAWLSLRGTQYPKTHDLRVLFLLIEKTDSGKTDQFFDLVDLIDFAVEYRYDIYNDEPVDRNSVTSQVGELLEYVESIIGG